MSSFKIHLTCPRCGNNTWLYNVEGKFECAICGGTTEPEEMRAKIPEDDASESEPFPEVDRTIKLHEMDSLIKDIARNVAAIEETLSGADRTTVYQQIRNLLAGYFMQQDTSCRDKAIKRLRSDITAVIESLSSDKTPDLAFRICYILEYLLLLGTQQ